MARISRREMLRSGALASAFAASGGPLLARGQRGGRLRAGVSGASKSDTWDMRVKPDLFMLAASHGAVFECLTEVACDGSLKGELATEWHSHDGGRIWEFSLRRDAVFHNGSLLTSKDVLSTFDQHGARPSLLAQVRSIRLIGAHSLEFELFRPNASFPYELSHPQLTIQPADAYGSGLGTGLYRVTHFAPGARFLGRRVDQHWKGDTAGFFDEVELIALNTLAEQRAALKAGSVDVVSDLGEAATQLRSVRLEHGLATRQCLRLPKRIGHRLPMDDARFAERWWMA